MTSRIIGAGFLIVVCAALSGPDPAHTAPAPQRGRTGGNTAAIEQALDAIDKTEARLKNPLLAWTTRSPTEIIARTYIRVPSDTVRVTAICGSNGVSVKFSLQSLVSDPLNFDWYDDPDNEALIADVRVIVDNVAVHVATGYAEKTPRNTFYGNNLGVLFYDPATKARAERGASTGIRELDALLGTRGIADAWARTTPGSIARLLGAQSFRVELPIKGREDPVVLDLNPQDKVLHTFAADCNARLSSTTR